MASGGRHRVAVKPHAIACRGVVFASRPHGLAAARDDRHSFIAKIATLRGGDGEHVPPPE